MDTMTERTSDGHSWPQGVQTITLFVEDLERTRAFYQAAFDLPVIFESHDSAVFRFGQTQVNLLQVASAPELVEPAPVGSPTAGTRAVFTIPVDDVDVRCAELRRRGVTLLNGPLDRPWGVRTASFQDPAGHIWEIAAEA